MTQPTGFRPTDLRLVAAPGAVEGVLRLEVHGFLDYDGAEYFLATAVRHLTAAPGPHTLHLDCAHLAGIDSMGLAMLLMLHRRTTAAHVTLHLEGRPPALERMLEITGTLDHLVPGRLAGAGQTETPQVSGRRTPEDGIGADRAGRAPAGPDTRA